MRIDGKMCISFHNTSVFIENLDGHTICLTLDDMLFNYSPDEDPIEETKDPNPNIKTQKQAR